MEPFLHDPKVQDALGDPKVKHIMQVLKADPEKAQRLVSSSCECIRRFEGHAYTKCHYCGHIQLY